MIVEGTGDFALHAGASSQVTEPIDGVASIVLHETRVGEDPEQTCTIRWDENHRSYVAESSAQPGRVAPVAPVWVRSWLNAAEVRRDTLSLPVQTSDFIVVLASHIAIERPAGTSRTIRQSMENLRTVCADPETDRCQNHRAYTTAYQMLSTIIRDAVDRSLSDP